MLDNRTLGLRIRNFRKRSGMSQFELENAINASPGSLSRIENGEVNPTKETIGLISEALKLNDREQDYLGGSLALPADEKEIASLLSTVKEHFEKFTTLAYILDERHRVIAYSKSFPWFLKMSNEEALKAQSLMQKKTIPQFLIDDGLGIKKFLSDADYINILTSALKAYYHEAGFMIDDYYYQETLKDIVKNEKAYKIWSEVKSDNSIPLDTMHGRVHFKIGLISIGVDYISESVVTNPRFQIIEYRV